MRANGLRPRSAPTSVSGGGWRRVVAGDQNDEGLPNRQNLSHPPARARRARDVFTEPRRRETPPFDLRELAHGQRYPQAARPTLAAPRADSTNEARTRAAPSGLPLIATRPARRPAARARAPTLARPTRARRPRTPPS